MKQLDCAVIGAGPTGLAAAYELTKLGHKVTVLEKANELGGLAASINIQGTPLERYYHHLFATDTTFISVCEELGLRHKLYFKQLPTGIYYQGAQYAFGTPFEMLRFSPIPLSDRIRFAATSFYLKMYKNHLKLTDQNALEWSRKHAGKSTTQVIWKPLLENKFGTYATDISMAWLWARIHYRTFRLGYMHGGFDQVYTALAKRITSSGGKILFNQSIGKISQASKKSPVKIKLQKSTKQFDRVIATVPQPLFAEMIGAPDKNDLWQARYLGATCFILELKKSITPYYWLNINDPDFPFLAVIEQTRLASSSEYGNRHIVYVGNYVSRDDWRYNEQPELLLKKYIPYLKKINSAFKASDILSWHFSKAPYGQPIVNSTYHTHIPPHTTPLSHVWLATMSQVYPMDRGQNYALKMGIKVARLATESQ